MSDYSGKYNFKLLKNINFLNIPTYKIQLLFSPFYGS